jgi:hypothetical protein
VAVSPVIQIEEAVFVEMSGSLDHPAFLVHVERDYCRHRIEVPAIMWRILVMPLDLAAIGIYGDCGGRIQIVARTIVRIPRRRVAGAAEKQVGVGIVRAAVPGGRSARLPQIAGPSGAPLARHGAFLAVESAHPSLDVG